MAISSGSKRNPAEKLRFFASQAAWRRWLAANHDKSTGLWVGFRRVATGKRSITWPQSVDEALCFGWIDGIRRGLDDESYAIRFSPRANSSRWSRLNLKRHAELEAQGHVHEAGTKARERWERANPAGHSNKTVRAGLDAPSLANLNRNSAARRFWEAQAPWYRTTAGHWVMSAKREETRAARLGTLIECCARGRAIPPLRWARVKKPH